MARREKNKLNRVRVAIAQEVARILVSASSDDPYKAKLKALENLRFPGDTPLPSNAEIETAVKDYMNLFGSTEQFRILLGQRKTACGAMKHFEQFRPRLLTGFLSAVDLPGAVIELHLFSDSLEEISLILMHDKIPFEITEKLYDLSNGVRITRPALSFNADQCELLLVVFASNRAGYPPKTKGDKARLKTIGMVELDLLISDVERRVEQKLYPPVL